MGFPRDFVWGAATSAYQIEGAASQDGRGPSIWDAMCRRSGAVFHGHTGDVACDHYHRFPEDVALMRQFGLQAYRFSVSWSRVIPNGTGEVNEKGIAFYDRLVDELCNADITPFVTLFHWDYPQALYDRGGWLNRDSADWFGDYASVVVERLSDRVSNWMTINEIQVYLHCGHFEGSHAPGDKLPLDQVLLAGHNLLRAHGKAVQAVRANSKTPSKVGFAPVGVSKIPATGSPSDVAAAVKASGAMSREHLYSNAWWLDPILLGKYPEEGLRLYQEDVPEIHDGDMQTMHQPLDFLGLNIYFGNVVRAGESVDPEEIESVPSTPLTATNMPVTPEALYWGPKLLWERYELPIFITENGMSSRDWVALDGAVYDPQRIDFLHRYLLNLRKAVDDGVDVRGYFLWSLLDNFEWAAGYRERFGFIYVDYETQQRIPKDSAYWYQNVIESNGASLEVPMPKACDSQAQREG